MGLGGPFFFPFLVSEVSSVGSALSFSRVSGAVRSRGGPESKAVPALGQPRRRPMWLWGGGLAMVACAAAFMWLASAAGQRTDVLVLARDVSAGQEIGRADLRQVAVAADGGVIPAARAAAVLGKTAAVPLVKGALLAPGQVGSRADYPPRGVVEAAVAVEAGKAPRKLVAGQRVAVVPGGPADETVVGDGGKKKVAAEEDGVVGSVASVRAPAASGGPREVTLLVDVEAARRLAGWEHPYLVVVAAKGGVAP